MLNRFCCIVLLTKEKNCWKFLLETFRYNNSQNYEATILNVPIDKLLPSFAKIIFAGLLYNIQIITRVRLNA